MVTKITASIVIDSQPPLTAADLHQVSGQLLRVRRMLLKSLNKRMADIGLPQKWVVGIDIHMGIGEDKEGA